MTSEVACQPSAITISTQRLSKSPSTKLPNKIHHFSHLRSDFRSPKPGQRPLIFNLHSAGRQSLGPAGGPGGFYHHFPIMTPLARRHFLLRNTSLNADKYGYVIFLLFSRRTRVHFSTSSNPSDGAVMAQNVRVVSAVGRGFSSHLNIPVTHNLSLLKISFLTEII